MELQWAGSLSSPEALAMNVVKSPGLALRLHLKVGVV